MIKVSLITTVFNEAGSIEKLLDSLNRQTRRPDEVIIVDGGSRDKSPDIIRGWSETHPELPVVLKIEPGANISRGRNLAIAAATHEIIAATDAGVRLLPDWLEQLVKPFQEQGKNGDVPDLVVCGFFQADPAPGSAFEVAMGATVLPVEQDIKPDKFLPSSRSVAFTRRCWEQTGGYPEWLDYCEDLIFDMDLKKAGFPFIWQPGAVALFKPRSSLKAFYQQYYRYARGDGKADLFLKRHLLRYFIYLAFTPILICIARRRPLTWAFLGIAGEAYIIKPHRRLLRKQVNGFAELSLVGKVAALAYVSLIRLVGDVAKMAGYPMGIAWRRRFLLQCSHHK